MIVPIRRLVFGLLAGFAFVAVANAQQAPFLGPSAPGLLLHAATSSIETEQACIPPPPPEELPPLIPPPATVPGPRPDLHVRLSIEEDPPYCGGQIVHYVLLVSNSGASMAADARTTVTDRLPPGAVLVGWSAREDVTCAPVTPPDLVCSGPSLARSELFIMRLTVQLGARGGNLTNQVAVDPWNRVPERNENNNSSQLTIRVLPAVP